MRHLKANRLEKIFSQNENMHKNWFLASNHSQSPHSVLLKTSLTPFVLDFREHQYTDSNYLIELIFLVLYLKIHLHPLPPLNLAKNSGDSKSNFWWGKKQTSTPGGKSSLEGQTTLLEGNTLLVLLVTAMLSFQASQFCSYAIFISYIAKNN